MRSADTMLLTVNSTVVFIIVIEPESIYIYTHFCNFKQKNRGNYRCSRCNLPKKGHICPYQPRFRKKHIECTGVNTHIENATLACRQTTLLTYTDVGTQVELDSHMTVAALGDLTQQGSPASYDLHAF
ncbi:hypothetical protein EON65_56240 [archaeon]|nr:MAG: hypothetical protein EON65_56240 [archaeon]